MNESNIQSSSKARSVARIIHPSTVYCGRARLKVQMKKRRRWSYKELSQFDPEKKITDFPSPSDPPEKEEQEEKALAFKVLSRQFN